MENLRVLEINDAGEIVKYLNLSSKVVIVAIITWRTSTLIIQLFVN